MSDDQLDFVREKLGVLGPVVSRRMFGGVGFYLDGVFFALMMGDRLYFKVDDDHRHEFEEAGMEAFEPFADGKRSSSYFEVPERVLQSRELLKSWGQNALAAARAHRARSNRSRRRDQRRG
jgi:DNA transformation protein